jgi:hypothetical protein
MLKAKQSNVERGPGGHLVFRRDPPSITLHWPIQGQTRSKRLPHNPLQLTFKAFSVH